MRLTCFLLALVTGCAQALDTLKTRMVILSWDPVETDVDGTPCVDLRGYFVHQGMSHRVYTERRFVGNVVEYRCYVPAAQKIFFAVSAIDTADNESSLSEEAFVDPEPVLSDSTVRLPDNRPIRLLAVYKKLDTAGIPLDSRLVLEWRQESIQTGTEYGWYGLTLGSDYRTFGDTLRLDIDRLKPYIYRDSTSAEYANRLSFRARLENPDDSSLATGWKYSTRKVILFVPKVEPTGIPQDIEIFLILEME